MEPQIVGHMVLGEGMPLRDWLLFHFVIKFTIKFTFQITKYGETICHFDLPLKKQPFERIFIACHMDSTHAFNISDEQLIYSVPSGIHSHKPPLHGLKNRFDFSFIDEFSIVLNISFICFLDLLRPFAVESDSEYSSLELFARYLLPNCTSIGLEVLKLQNLQLFCDETSGNASIERNDNKEIWRKKIKDSKNQIVRSIKNETIGFDLISESVAVAVG